MDNGLNIEGKCLGSNFKDLNPADVWFNGNNKCSKSIEL